MKKNDNNARRFDDMNEAINLTPMINVIFLMLLFFVAISSHSNVEFEDVSLPSSTEGADLKARQILAQLVFTINPKDDSVMLEGRPLSDEELKQRITEAVRNNPKTNVVIRNRSEAPCGRTGGRLVRLCAAYGVTNVSMAVMSSQ